MIIVRYPNGKAYGYRRREDLPSRATHDKSACSCGQRGMPKKPKHANPKAPIYHGRWT